MGPWCRSMLTTERIVEMIIEEKLCRYFLMFFFCKEMLEMKEHNRTLYTYNYSLSTLSFTWYNIQNPAQISPSSNTFMNSKGLG